MAVTYNKLRHMLVDLNKNMSDIHKDTGVSWNSLTRINKDEYVSLQTLEVIAVYLGCDIGDIVEIKK